MVLVTIPVAFLLAALEPEPIVTDRPDFTESSLVVGRGRVQVESGASFEAGPDSARSFTLPAVLVRIGLNNRWEARIGLPNYHRVEFDESNVKGLGDTYLGAKVQLGPSPDGTEFALIPAMIVPTGNRELRAESVSSEIKACFGRELSGGRSLSGMLAVSWVEEEGTTVSPCLATLSYGIPVDQRMGMFMEYVLAFQRDLNPRHFAHSGFTYQPSPHIQLDFHFGFGISKQAPDASIGAGFSVRF